MFALARVASGVAVLVIGSHVCAQRARADEPSRAFTRSPAGYRHDGFYFRAGSGFGAFDERLSSEQSAIYGGEIRGRNRGIAQLGEVALGGTVGKGWVIGGGIYSADLLASTFKDGEDSSAAPPAELDTELRSLALIGPFLDWYPNPERGLHFQTALGLATLTPRVFGDSATERSEYLALGAGLMLGAGYETWVAEEWSLGVLARSTIAVVTGKDDADVRWLHLAVTSPALLISLTYH